MCTFTIEETTEELYIIILRGSPAKLMKVLRCTNNYMEVFHGIPFILVL